MTTDRKDYSFCLFTIKPDGARVIWEVTNTCNYECSYCIFSSKREHKKNELSTQKMKDSLKEMREQWFKYFKITWGEPFVRKDLPEIVQYATSLWFVTDISTNASLVTQKTIDQLKWANISYIHISLDGRDKETQEIVRGKWTFQPTMKWIKFFVENGYQVRVWTLVHKHNQDHLEEIVELVASLWVNEIIFSFMEPVGRMRWKDESPLLTTKTAEQLEGELAEIKERYKDKIVVSYSFAGKPKATDSCQSCPGCTKFLSINHQGQISPCTRITEHLPQFNTKWTLNEKSFGELIKSQEIVRYQDFIQTLQTYGVVGCPKQSLSIVKEILMLSSFFRNGAKFKESKKFSAFNQIYAFTTENVSWYMDLLFAEGRHYDSALVVWWSWDHIFNLLSYKSLKTTWVDVNLFAKYYFELKSAGLKTLSYHQFETFFFKSSPYALEFDVYAKLKYMLSPQAAYFRDAVYKLHDNEWSQLRASDLFRSEFENDTATVRNNRYLQSEELFELTKENLLQADILRKQKNVLEYTTGNLNQFDLILLWNLWDYAELMFEDKDPLQGYFDKIVDPLHTALCDWWVIGISYVYDAQSSSKRSSIDNEEIRKKTFTLPWYREHLLPSVIDDAKKDIFIYAIKNE